MYFASFIFHLVTSTIIFSTATSGKCVGGPVQNTRCRVECGVDYPGGDYAQQAVSSLDACVALCNGAAPCTDAQYHEENGYCYLKKQLTSSRQVAKIDSVICSKSGSSTTKTTKTTTTKRTTSTSPTPSSCASGTFIIQMTLSAGDLAYFFDYGNDPSFVSSNDVTTAGRYLLNGTTLYSVAVPGAIVYSISGFGPGPNPPPNGRVLYEGTPGTLDPSTGEALPIQVTVTDQTTCTLTFTDGVRTVIGVAGFRGGPGVYITLPGTTSNFNPASVVKAVKV